VNGNIEVKYTGNQVVNISNKSFYPLFKRIYNCRKTLGLNIKKPPNKVVNYKKS
jgi:hypothetical protein